MSEHDKAQQLTPLCANKYLPNEATPLLEVTSSDEGDVCTVAVKQSLTRSMSGSMNLFNKKLSEKLHRTASVQLQRRQTVSAHTNTSSQCMKKKCSIDNIDQGWPAVPLSPVFGVPLQVSTRAHARAYTRRSHGSTRACTWRQVALRLVCTAFHIACACASSTYANMVCTRRVFIAYRRTSNDWNNYASALTTATSAHSISKRRTSRLVC
jgi:hypothetical protein